MKKWISWFGVKDLDRRPQSRDLNLLITFGMNRSTNCESHLVT